jgi:4-amino-4-deoxy-L-arabinose transferase-like glycosyltransferase
MVRPRAALAAAAAALVGIGMRVRNALTFPPDWGFDASFNWQYIYALTRSWRLPDPDAAWSTGDPPLYFYLAASVLRTFGMRPLLLPLLNTLLGLAIVGLAVALVRRAAPADPQRALLAGGLLLFLPAHVHMSAMVNEELLVALLTSLAVFCLAGAPRAAPDTTALRPALAGLAGGLAALGKPTGLVAIAACAASVVVVGLRKRAPRTAVVRVGALLLAALLAGGWYYARNRIVHGYFQPVGLPAHERMFEMPPGERGPLDYVRVPLSTFTDPQLLDPDLLHSVWGSTYAAVWFDAHRYFLPTDSGPVRRLGTLTLLLALLPTAAFAAGVLRGVSRWRKGAGERDLPLLLLLALTLAGFALYTWSNPWFAVIKGTTLLGLSLPYAFYASEVLADWSRRGRVAAVGIGMTLLALAVSVTISCTFDGLFERTEVSGLRWETTEGR